MTALTPSESEELVQKLNSIWGITRDYWTPLDGNSAREDLIYYPQDYFYREFKHYRLTEVLEKLNDDRILCWSFETNPNEFYSVAPDELERYDGLERFYCGSDYDWVIYQSHEDTITFAGKKLIDALKESWEDWQDNVNEWYEIKKELLPTKATKNRADSTLSKLGSFLQGLFRAK